MASPEQDIAQLEGLLRQLEKEYDLFLCGQLRREPTATENAVLALVRTYASRPLQNSSLGFKYASLVARYNAFRTVWSRRLREREEGRGALACGGKPLAAPRPSGNPHPVAVAANPSEYLAIEPEHERRRLHQFYEHYRKLRAQAGESADGVKAEQFEKALADKIAKIKREQRCEAVLVRLIADGGKTRIVAKPFRRAAETP